MISTCNDRQTDRRCTDYGRRQVLAACCVVRGACTFRSTSYSSTVTRSLVRSAAADNAVMNVSLWTDRRTHDQWTVAGGRENY